MYPTFDTSEPVSSLVAQLGLTQLAIDAILQSADSRTRADFRKAMQNVVLVADQRMSAGALKWLDAIFPAHAGDQTNAGPERRNSLAERVATLSTRIAPPGIT